MGHGLVCNPEVRLLLRLGQGSKKSESVFLRDIIEQYTCSKSMIYMINYPCNSWEAEPSTAMCRHFWLTPVSSRCTQIALEVHANHGRCEQLRPCRCSCYVHFLQFAE